MSSSMTINTYKSGDRYVYKYYVPNEIKSRIHVADLTAIQQASMENRVTHDKSVPDDGLFVEYAQFGVKKWISPEDAQAVIVAYDKFYDDIRAILTDSERQAAQQLNHWLRQQEKDVLAYCRQLNAGMQQRLHSTEDPVSDYEIDIRVSFYVREDDPFYDDDDANRFDPDCDASLLWIFNDCVKSHIQWFDENHWGWGDDHDHNDRLTAGASDVNNHCAWFHELYDHAHLPMKHMTRIGKVWVDIQVQHQMELDSKQRYSSSFCRNGIVKDNIDS
ncbi:MAG: hypothetical protein HQL99_16820 [Magnetococcales bacterium]|nr:hypothetical protein [Magnetococcales bacterium]